jgi:hypothetical protein
MTPKLTHKANILTGQHPELRGDCSELRGNCTGLTGDLDECGLTDAERSAGVDVADLVTKSD